MGTRSTVTFIEKRGKTETPLVNIYQQYDGYLEGVGYELAQFLSKFTIVNGISLDAKFGEIANGTGCLAAQFISKFKTEVGNLYITTFEDEEDFDYKVVVDEDVHGKADECIKIIVTSYGSRVFYGSPTELIEEVERRTQEDEH